MDKIKLLLNSRCPKCGIGRLFKHNPYNIYGFMIMFDSCSNCKVTFMPEPGFYVGAMYFSYGFNIAIMILSGLASYWWFGFINVWVNLGVITFVVIILTPLIFRFSRVLMLHLFGGRIYHN